MVLTDIYNYLSQGETVLDPIGDFPEELAKKDVNDAPATVFDTENKIIEEEEEEENEDIGNGGENRGYDASQYTNTGVRYFELTD